MANRDDSDNSVDAQRAIGRIEGRLQGFESRLGAIELGMKDQDGKLDLLVTRSSAERGQRLLLWKMGGFAVGFTAIVSELAHWFRGH